MSQHISATARYTKCVQVGQRTDGTFVAFQQHFKHRQPQHKVHCIELCIALVTKLVMLQACMTELSQVNNMKVEWLSHCAWLVRVHFTKRPKMLINGRTVTRQHSFMIINLRADRQTVHCISKLHNAVVSGRLGDKIFQIISLAIKAQQDDISISK